MGVKTLTDLGIKIDTGRSGNQMTLCPQCSHLRKKHNKRCLSVKRDDKGFVFRCHHCDYRGGVIVKSDSYRMVPEPGNLTSDFGGALRRVRYANAGKT
jgi:hypothetical protein